MFIKFCVKVNFHNKKSAPFGGAFTSDDLLGFEPRKSEPKTDVLPLHHRSVSN